MREQWGTRSGFVLASIGAAVGLGNIWRFSYVAGENGGGAFLLLYVVFVVLIGIPLVIAELAIGKRGATDAVTAVESLVPASRWRRLGWLGVVTAALLLSFYGVIAGWALRYFAAALDGSLWQDQGFDRRFADFTAGTIGPAAWQLGMMLATVLVVGGGVGRGIERVNLLLMPLLAVLVVGLAVHALTLPGSASGVAFLFAPDWAAITEPRVMLAALGQAFFSIGIGAAVFVTYGGYMRHQFGIATSAGVIVLGDMLFALVAGLAIFPAIFALGGSPAAGPQLAFVVLPQVVQSMPGGAVVAAVFFFLLSAAALTSMVSLLEVPVAVAIQRLGLGRWRAAAGIGLAIAALGLPSALSHGALSAVTPFGLPILDAVDAVVSNLLLPLSGLALAWLLGCVVSQETREAATALGKGGLAWTYAWLLRAALLLIGLPIVLRLLDWFG